MRKTMLAALIVTAASVLTVPAFAQNAAPAAKVGVSASANAAAQDSAGKTADAADKMADKTVGTTEKATDKTAATTEKAAHKATKHTTHKAKTGADTKVEAGSQPSGQ